MSNARQDLDADALAYQEHWQPVLEQAGRRLFHRVIAHAPGALRAAGAATVDKPVPRLLDLGAGTGALTLLALEHWPHASIVGLDASAAMLAVARSRLAARALDVGDTPVEWLVRDAQATGLAAGSFDVVVSAFMLQLVPDRLATLREVERVLRPGGLFGFVTWTADEVPMLADSDFDEAVYELELDDPASTVREPKPDEYASVEQAQDELRAAGFDHVDARADRLQFSWSRDGYLRFKEAYDERELFDSLDVAARVRLRETVRRRWQGLADSDFTFEAGLVSAIAVAR